jgi:hypothetical protein
MSRMNPIEPTAILADLRWLIDHARQKAAAAVNAQLSLLYWHIGRRLNKDIAGGKRAGYG